MLIPRLETRTRLVLVIHRYEDRKPTNTGRLAAACLPNSEVIVRGHVPRSGAPPETLSFDRAVRPVFLFPSEEAVPLASFASSQEPVALIVPDGTWRQASKVKQRVRGLESVPCVSLPPGPPSLYRLRAEPRPGGLATMEAIARALGVLEGPPVQIELERVLLAMVERTLWARGELDTAGVTSGLPAGALRHDPESGARLQVIAATRANSSS